MTKYQTIFIVGAILMLSSFWPFQAVGIFLLITSGAVLTSTSQK